jgi:hypothetical protein
VISCSNPKNQSHETHPRLSALLFLCPPFINHLIPSTCLLIVTAIIELGVGLVVR